MTAFLITMAVISLLKCGIFLSRQPGTKQVSWSAGELLIGAFIHACFGGWALYLLIGSRA